MIRRPLCLALLVAANMLLAIAIDTASAGAFTGSPWWHVSTRMFPSNLPPGGQATVVLQASNLGDGPTTGEPVLTETFPAGIAIESIELYTDASGPVAGPFFDQGLRDVGPYFCESSADRAQCRFPEGAYELIPPLQPYEDLEMRVTVKDEGVNPGESQMSAEVTGGQAPTVTAVQQMPVTSTAPTFGVEHFSLVPEEEGGSVDVRAGSHPFQLTSSFTVTESADQARPLGMTRNLDFKLPPGLIGNATRLPKCSDADFKGMRPTEGNSGALETPNLCRDNTVVGVAMVTIDEPVHIGLTTAAVPLFNLAPERGEPARFGFEITQAPVILDTHVRTGGDYGVTVSVHNITELAGFISSTVTFWGVPSDERHDAARGWGCVLGGEWYPTPPGCHPFHENEPAPLLVMPSACGPFTAMVEGSSWPNVMTGESMRLGPASYSLTDEFGRDMAVTGCKELPFEPSMRLAPEERNASHPTGFDVTLHMPEQAGENANGLEESSIKNVQVALPPGVAVNPAGAGGLETCSEVQAGYLAGQSYPSAGVFGFDPGLSEGWEEGAGGFCPTAAKIGTVDISSRLLPPGEDLKGAVYLATQDENPFGSLIALYLVAQDPVSGVTVKMAGEVKLDEHTGQLITTFRHFPQLPFEDATLHFFGGARAPLTTPVTCGTYTTNAAFTPWSANPEHEAASVVNTSSSFTIDKAPDGGPCVPSGFTPSLIAGSTNVQAGAFSPFTMTMSHTDGQQPLKSISMHMPPGLLGLLSSVKLCAEAQANAGTCGAESLIGETAVTVGLGGEPFTVTGGKVYITGPYDGAPYGLSIVNPAKAGPFDLVRDTGCDCIVVRAKIEVDPVTAQLTVTSDATGEHAIPTILKGIPLEIKHVNVTISRPGFIFNPTDCDPLSVGATLTSGEGAISPVSVPFQVHDCAKLAFKPRFTASTSAKTSRKDGVSLDVKLSFPKGSLGKQANVRSVKVDLPRQLPSRLETLKRACPDYVFAQDPASCPAASRVGSATATTPVLPVTLTGPAYFVSHGGREFPELVVVLQGYGVTVQLHGETFISRKTGVTSSTFRTVPDVPVETFELRLPQGPYSALGANANLCTHKLRMPNAFVAQNGMTIHQSTPIKVIGCARHRPHRRHRRHK
jgi:hypothetical protein